jgi:hypothetical protein
MQQILIEIESPQTPDRIPLVTPGRVCPKKQTIRGM